MNATAVTLDAFYEAVFLVDPTLRIIDCNTRAAELFHLTSKADFIGRKITDIPSDHALSAEFPTFLRDRLTRVPFVVVECRLTRDDGSSFFAETVCHLMEEGNLLFTARDISVRTESLHRLEVANERLRAANRDRMEFVSNVSHELRSPLTSMTYALANIRRGICGPLPEKLEGYLERLQVDVKRLMTTVNDILDLRQVENGTLTLQKTRVPLYRLLSETTEALAIQAESKRQTMTCAVPLREVWAEADRHKMERVVFNMISNAVKYTPDGGTITVTLQEENGNAWLQVDDTGIGIPPEALSRVSQRYFRVGDQTTGTGLGLSIVREIMELHGGELKIDSPVPGTACGTRVRVRIPTSPGPLLVIISGDNAFISRLEATAEAIGSTVLADREGLQIAAVCANRSPARFILDGSLPEACLTDIILQIRGHAAIAKVPILILSREISQRKRYDYTRMQVDVRTEPIPPETLRALCAE